MELTNAHRRNQNFENNLLEIIKIFTQRFIAVFSVFLSINIFVNHISVIQLELVRIDYLLLSLSDLWFIFGSRFWQMEFSIYDHCA